MYMMNIRETVVWTPFATSGGISAVLYHTVRLWCDANLGPWRLGYDEGVNEEGRIDTRMYFDTEADALMFKLRWYGIKNPNDLPSL